MFGKSPNSPNTPLYSNSNSNSGLEDGLEIYIFALFLWLPLNGLALVARGTCILVSHGKVTIREIVLGIISLLGHCKDSRLKQTPLSVKEDYFLFWSFGRGAGLRFGIKLGAGL